MNYVGHAQIQMYRKAHIGIDNLISSFQLHNTNILTQIIYTIL